MISVCARSYFSASSVTFGTSRVPPMWATTDDVIIRLTRGRHGTHDVLRLDVERGVLIGGTEVPHRPVGDHELARHRPHLEAVSPPHRLQRAAHEVLVALLGEPRGAGELDVRFV